MNKNERPMWFCYADDDQQSFHWDYDKAVEWCKGNPGATVVHYTPVGAPKEIHVLMRDIDMTMHSVPEPIGVAVVAKEDAEKFRRMDESANAYRTITIHGTLNDALRESRR